MEPKDKINEIGLKYFGDITSMSHARELYQAGQESEKAHWAKEIESQVKGAYEGGIRKVIEIYKKENPWSYQKYHIYWDNLQEKLIGKPNSRNGG